MTTRDALTWRYFGRNPSYLTQPDKSGLGVRSSEVTFGTTPDHLRSTSDGSLTGGGYLLLLFTAFLDFSLKL